VDDKSQSARRIAARAAPFIPPRATLAQFLNGLTPRLPISTGNNTRSTLPTSRVDWPSVRCEIFTRAFFALARRNRCDLRCRPLSRRRPSVCARAIADGVARAQNQEWSHLILAGWNEGAWPPPAGAEFARAEEIRAFNPQRATAQQGAERQGSQGGATPVFAKTIRSIRAGEQRAIALRQFDALLESASEGVTLHGQSGAGRCTERVWNPSECFTELYLKRGVGRSRKRR